MLKDKLREGSGHRTTSSFEIPCSPQDTLRWIFDILSPFVFSLLPFPIRNTQYDIRNTKQIRRWPERLWSYRPVVDANVINQAGEETAGFKILAGTQI